MATSKKKLSGSAKLIILMLVLVLLLGLLYAVKAYNNWSEEKEAALAEGTVMMSFDTDDVATFSYTIDGNEYNFMMGDDGWVYTLEPDAALDQSAVDSMLDTISKVTTNTIVSDDLTNIADYGLDEPTFSVEITMNDGTEYKLYIGMENEMVGVDYAYIEGDDRIFAVDTSLEEAFVSPESLVSTDTDEEDENVETTDEENTETTDEATENVNAEASDAATGEE